MEPHHSLEGLHNGIYPDQFEHVYNDPANNGFGSSWPYNAAENPVSTASHSLSLYSQWQNPSTADHSMTAYGRPLSKSPSFPQQSPYADYGNSPQYQQASYDPALISQPPADRQFNSAASPFTQPPQSAATIAPRALENEPIRSTTDVRTFDHHAYTGAANQISRPYMSAPSVDQSSLCATIPSGVPSGHFSLVDFDELCRSTNSKRANLFVNVGQQAFEYPINRAALPTPVQRRSRNGLREIAVGNPKLQTKLGKKATKKLSKLAKVPAVPQARVLAKPGQTTALVKAESESSTEESSSEEDTSDDESEDELSRPSPLPSVRPTSPLEAVRYDSIKALWRAKRSGLSAADVRNGLKDYWEIVRTIRDRWKTDAAAVTQAEEKKRIGELPLLRSRVKDQRDMIEVALKAAVEHGHRSILELSSENHPFLFLCYQFLLDRHKENDVNGPLARSILEILALCTTLNDEALQKTHLVKVLPRYAKKGNTETQDLVKRIEHAAKEASKKSQSETVKTDSVESKTSTITPQVKSPLSARPAPESVAGVKRAAQSAPSGQPPKKLASSAADVQSTNQAALKGPTSTTSVVKRAAPAAPPAKSAAPVKPKVAVSRPSGFFSGLQSSTKKAPAPATTKPAISSVVASALKSVNEKPSVAASAQAAVNKASFSFADTIANLTTPKQTQASSKQSESKQMPETAEERKKRLRKEARKGLRVTFKPESAMVEIRYLSHDPEEELGHDASMTRDVADVGGEGRMFKQHKDMMEIDEDDDGQGEEMLKPYRDPPLIDFSDVDQEERERNYAPYGGGQLQPESPEKSTREQYEANTLMVFYTDPKDIPASPREPEDVVEDGNTEEVKSFGAPQGIAGERAAKVAAQAPMSSRGASQQQPAMDISPDISALLAALAPQSQQQAPVAPQPAPQHPDQMADLARILAQFGPATAQPPAQQAQPQQSTNPLANLMSSVQSAGGSASNMAQAQQQQHFQQPSHFPPPGPDMSPVNLAAIYAQLNQNQSGAAPPNAMGLGPNGFPGLPFDLQNIGSTNQQQNYPYENDERRRWREGGGGDDGGNGNDSKRSNNYKQKSEFNNKHFTLPCKYYKDGMCRKGAACTYRHED